MLNRSGTDVLRLLMVALAASFLLAASEAGIRDSAVKAATPIATVGEIPAGTKKSLFYGEVVLNGSVSSDHPADAFAFEWYGPFGVVTGSPVSVQIPQGTYTVSFQAVGCPESAAMDTAEITISPAFPVAARSKTGVVQLTWTHTAGTIRYDVYRANESDPFSFEKIAETTSSYATYLDSAVVNERNYLYAVAAIDAGGGEHYSDIIAACPPATRITAKSNRPPVIYSPPVGCGAPGIPYAYSVLAADANDDALSYSLVTAPPDMTIDPETGNIQWTPAMTGSYPVTVSTTDGKGLSDSQSFQVDVGSLAPTVTIAARPDVVTPGKAGMNRSTLTWCSTHAGSCKIEPDIGQVDISGSIAVFPAETTDYTITATGPGGEATDSVMVAARMGAMPPPEIDLIAAPDRIVQGESVWLYWRSINASVISIDQGIGEVSANGCYGGEGGYPGMVPGECGEGEKITPHTTTTYTITASGPGGTASASVTVTVSRPPPFLEVVAIPDQVEYGACAWLYWHSANAHTVTIDQGIGEVPLNGCHGGDDEGFWDGGGDDCGMGRRVTPTDTTSYTVTATGPGGTTSDSVTITVAEPPPPTVDLIADPEVVQTGGTTWLFWHSTYAETVFINQNIGVVAANGCFFDTHAAGFPLDGGGECGEGMPVSPAVATTYTITAIGPGGVATDSVTVAVDRPPPPVVDIRALPEAIQAGDASWLQWQVFYADSVFIDQGIGSLTCEDGYGGYGGCDDQLAVAPGVTTAYTITATGPGGTATDSVTVYVGEAPPPAIEITATREAIHSGDTTWLVWRALNAAQVSLDQGIGDFVCGDDGYGGYDGRECRHWVAVTPAATTTYTLTATGPGGAASENITIFVDGGTPPDVTFKADPETIFRGQSTCLRWQTTHAERVAIDREIGEVPLASDETGLVVTPDKTTTYTLSAVGPGGRDSSRVTVRVLDPLPPLVDLIAWPATIAHGQKAVLAWTSAGAESISISADPGPDIGAVALNSGDGFAVYPPTTTTYTLTATGPAGTTADSATVNVLPLLAITPSKPVITAGEPCVLSIHTVNGHSVSIDQGVGGVHMTPGTGHTSSGTVSVFPIEKTTYTVTATGNGGTATTSVTILVSPRIEFRADKETIECGAQARLFWSTSAADRVTISPGLGEMDVSSGPAGVTVSPVANTTYVLTAENAMGAASASVRIRVNDFGKRPAVTTFQASPIIIEPDQTANLAWESVNALEARIDNGIGDVPIFGTLEVSPERTTTYTLVVQGPKGLVSANATVNVKGTYASGTFAARFEAIVPDGAAGPAGDRFSVLTGRCNDPNGDPMEGVTVSVLGHPAFGKVLTDDVGRYSIPVNGNNRYTVVMAKEGFLPIHRKAAVLNNRVAVLETTTPTVPDTVTTLIDFSADHETILFHGGRYHEDERGRRRLSLTIPYSETFSGPGNVTTTEYPSPTCLPAPLPPTAPYAYAAEIALSPENESDAAVHVPAIAWVDDFLGFPVGQPVPVGWYDREEGAWIPRPNGHVVRLLDTDNDGEIDGVDVTGDGRADDLDNDGDVTDETAGLPIGEVDAGKTYYRFAVDRTGPWALSWPYAPMNPSASPPDAPTYDFNAQTPDAPGPVAQDIAIPGTEFFLHYTEARASGCRTVITIPVTGPSVPAQVASIRVRMMVEGRVFEKNLPPDPDQTVRFEWDGKDYLGRQTERTAVAEIEIGYVHGRQYAFAGAFRHAFGQAGNGDAGIPVRDNDIAWHRNRIEIERLTRADDFIADGWTLSAHHIADTAGPAVLYSGDGGLLSTEGRLQANDLFACGAYGIIDHLSGNFYGYFGDYSGITVDDDSGEVFLSDGNFDVVWTVLADFGFDPKKRRRIPLSFAGDYTRRSDDLLLNPEGIDADQTGIFYVESGNNRIRKGVRNGDRYGFFAGNGQKGYSGDGQSALDASFSSPGQIARDHWGNLFLIDKGNHVIRKVSRDGIVETIAGNGREGSDGDNGPALAASISPTDIAVDAGGNIYLAEPAYYRVRKIDVSGIITTAAGTGVQGTANSGVPAASARLYAPENIAAGSLGTLYIGDYNRIVEIGSDAVLREKHRGDYRVGVMTTDMQDRIFFNDTIDHDVYRLSRPKFSDMADGDGFKFTDADNRCYYFSASGKHLWTGPPDAPIHTFTYDMNHLLVAVTDATGGPLLTVNRDENGTVRSLESAAGITALVMDDNHHLTELVTPGGASAHMRYDDEGILAEVTSTFAGGGIKGAVTDSETGLPLAEITVTLVTLQGSPSVRTATDGSYNFEDLDPGEYTLTFENAAYFSQCLKGVLIPGQCKTIPTLVMQAFSFPPEVISFKADPSFVVAGDTYTISWEARNTSRVELWRDDSALTEDGGPVGEFQATAGISNHAWYLKAFSPGGETETYRARITVCLHDCVMPVWGKISVTPDSIPAGETAVLKWESKYADIVKIDDAPKAGSGIMTVSPKETTTYALYVKNTATTEGAVYRATLTVTGGPDVSLQASPEAIFPGETVSLAWRSYRAETCAIEPGIGQVQTNGTITASPDETTVYTITATGPDGQTATDTATVTVRSPISVQIASPENGSVFSRPDVMVRGTVSNAAGNETGITVNGFPALVHGGEFVANHVPLQPGENTLTVTATDTAGNAANASVVVTAEALEDYVRITAIPESGVSPLETDLRIDGSFTITEASVSYAGPGDVEFLERQPDERPISATQPGIYYFSAEVEKDTAIYSDTVAVLIVDRSLLDAKLKSVYNGVKSALAQTDVEKAVSLFTSRDREKYREGFTLLSEKLPQIASAMGEIELIYVHGDIAKYRIHRPREINGEMVNISHYLYFRIDTDGIWRMAQL